MDAKDIQKNRKRAVNFLLIFLFLMLGVAAATAVTYVKGQEQASYGTQPRLLGRIVLTPLKLEHLGYDEKAEPTTEAPTTEDVTSEEAEE